jgi:S1-C subfamily serine protease
MPRWRKAALALIAALAIAVGAWMLRPRPAPETEIAEVVSAPIEKETVLPEESPSHPDLLLPSPPESLPELEGRQLYEAVRRAVVTVYVHRDGQLLASGSGAVIAIDAARTRYFVITNRHVVIHETPRDTSLSFEVEFENEARFRAVLDFYSREHDLALLGVSGTPLWAEAVAMRTRDDLQVGETVYAVGSPIGLRHTFTSGVISALRPDHIQTDATVHSGSSGGPLFDSHGLLCGVITATHTSKDFSFAIYADSVYAMLAERHLAAAPASPGDTS